MRRDTHFHDPTRLALGARGEVAEQARARGLPAGIDINDAAALLNQMESQR